MPDDVVGWVSGPTERGTLTLIWSCVITIFACTWTVLHLNLPGPDDTPLTIALRKAKWMAINILFPEFVFSKAVCDLRLALEELREFDEKLQDERQTIEWSTHHKDYDTRYTWVIQYPDRWPGLLYDLLRLDRPPHIARRHCPLRQFLGRFSFRTLSAPTDLENTGFELEPRRHGLANEDNRQAAAGQPHSGFINEFSSPQVSQRNLKINHAPNVLDEPNRGNQARTNGGMSKPAGGSHTGHDTDTGSPNALSPGQHTASQTTRIIPKRLVWTVVHSFYAQMGGLVFPAMCEGEVTKSTITASHLTRRFHWVRTSEITTHPIMHLILEKDEILDKSKADWLLKSLAMLQVAWIIINVIMRHATQLPISQLEIATMAFGIMAILTYLASWWKPKDISQPTVLQFDGWGHGQGDASERKRSFMRHIWSPATTMEEAKVGVLSPEDIRRVANDSVWLEGDVPLLYYLMAGSSLAFGGVHCLAWNFEFPTHVELICWRVASLASAILPMVALAIASLGHLVAYYFWERYFVPTRRVTKRLGLIFPVELLQHIMEPSFRHWNDKAQKALLRMPRELRDWEVSPKADIIEQWATEDTPHPFFGELAWVAELLMAVMVDTGEGSLIRNRGRWSFLKLGAGLCKSILEENPEILEFWSDYEDFLGTKHPRLRRVIDGGPITTYVQQIVKVIEEVSTQAFTFEVWAQRVTNAASVTNFIVYAAARLAILVILFTSLRAAPAGLYQDTTWSRFLPKVS